MQLFKNTIITMQNRLTAREEEESDEEDDEGENDYDDDDDDDDDDGDNDDEDDNDDDDDKEEEQEHAVVREHFVIFVLNLKMGRYEYLTSDDGFTRTHRTKNTY
ncbi:hypothetical protein LIER_38878 [Lithospermum erythrorhizon]|uniref:Uncharacterized protein n=1 Tax=Lithospermum erythrorhizon TaxID=34254 RepID=A0AAV3Q5X0_LITER